MMPKMPRMLGALVLLAAWLLAGCNGNKPECDADTPCGFGESCIEGVCVESRCSTSAQCPMEHYCESRECLAGCQNDDDCYPGDRCDRELGTCVAEGCVETGVDCGYREFCNPATGECYDAGDQYCRFCNDDEECGDGNYCLNHYCGVDCSGGRECPAGFECYPFGDQFGNVVAYQCFTYCWLYGDNAPGDACIEPPESVDDLGVGPIEAEGG